VRESVGQADVELLHALLALALGPGAPSLLKSEQADLNVAGAIANALQGLPPGIDRNLVPRFLANWARVAWVVAISELANLYAEVYPDVGDVSKDLATVSVAILTC